MKLVRYGAAGREKPGIIDGEGLVRDLSAVVPDINGGTLTPERLARLAGLRVDELPVVDTPRLGACIARPGNFIAIGLNYADHAAEAGLAVPQEPVIFNKAPNCICGPADDTMIPKGSTKLDYEVELGVVIGSHARYLESESVAMDAVAGYCLANDVSEREFQIERGGQWTKGKGCEGFGPLGPWLVTRDEIRDPQNLDMWLTVNGETRQKGNTRTMIFSVAHIVWYCSQYMVLEPGDVIITGTPPGVALGMKPQPKFLKAGDEVKLGIEGLGEQTQKIVAFKA
jgi:2-keto-4-pentenoate hydratase/2-oxohepta-3-ene-1,7-dioic acid hydratase in catechol pathway